MVSEKYPASEYLFGDQTRFVQSHAATLIARADGTFFAAWFGGTHESHSDVAIWGAARRAENPPGPNGKGPGAHWSEPRPIAKVSNDPHWNPVLFALTEDGQDVVLHFKVGASIRHWETWSQRSLDGGATWSEATRLVPGDRGGRGAVRNKPIRLVSGDWLAGASIERWRRWDAFFDRSPNGREGWEATALIRSHVRPFRGKGLIQPTLWESEPGRVHALFRSTDGHVHRSDSKDDGRTWSSSRALDVPNNNSGLDLAKLPSGTLALACNPVPGNWAARTPLSVLLSSDNGETFPRRIEIESEPGEFSYPALIAVGDDLALVYTWNRRRIAFRWIEQAEIDGA